MNERAGHRPAVPELPEFDAFISYRRSDGAAAAHWLRHGLERLRLPPELQRPGRRPLRCYIDVIYRRSSDDFFQKTIVPNLRASRYLILVATPGVLERRADGQRNWVEREIEEFRQTPQGANILIARAAGELGAPLPPVLAPDTAERSDVADLRGLRWRGRLRRPRPADPRDELLTLAATLYGMTEQEMPLLRREQERLRRAAARRRLRALTMLLVLFAGLFVWAAAGSIAARRELVRNHVAQGAALFAGQPATARLHFARAVELARLRLSGVTVWRVDDRLARQWLAEWRGDPPPSVFWLDQGEEVLGFSPDGRIALSQFVSPGAQRVSVRLIHLDTGIRRTTTLEFSTAGWPAEPPEFTRDGRLVLYGGRVFRTSDGAEVVLQQPRDIIPKARVLAPDGRRLLVVAKRLELYSLPDGRFLRRGEQREGDFWRAVFTPDGRSIITIDHRGTGEAWDAETLGSRGVRQPGFGDVDVPADFDDIPPEEDYDPPDAAAPVVSPDGRWIASDAPDGIRISRVEGLRLEAVLPVQLDRTRLQMRFAGDSERFLAVEDGGGVAIWHVPAILYKHLKLATPAVSAFWVPGTDEVVTVHADHGIRRWDAVRGFTLGTPRLHAGAITAARLVDARTLVTASTDQTVRRWTAARGATVVDLREDDPFVLAFDENETHLRFWSRAGSVLGAVPLRGGGPMSRRAESGASTPVEPLARSGDGGILLGRIASGAMVAVEVETGRFRGVLSPTPGCTAEPHLVLGLSHSGTGFAMWCASVGVEWRRLPGGERVGPPLRLPERPFAGSLSDDLRTAWLMTRNEVLRVNPERPVPIRLPNVVPALEPRTLVFSGDARRALVSIHTARRSPGGAGGADDGIALRIFDARSGRPLSALMIPDGLSMAALSPAGRLVVSCGVRMQAWDAQTGTPVGGPGISTNCVWANGLMIGPRGTVAMKLSQGSGVEIIDLRPVADPPDVLRRNAEREGLLRLDPATGGVQPLSRREWEALRPAVPRHGAAP